MPGEASQTGANRMLDALTGRATQTATTRYLALCTSAPSDTALGTEVTTAGSNGYARQAVTTWNAPTGDPSSTSNNTALTFGPFTADLNEVTHAMLMDAATGGTASNMVAWWQLTTPKNPAIDDTITVASGALVMTAD
jgi:hypothetical protein